MEGVFTLNFVSKEKLSGKRFVKGVMVIAVALLLLLVLTAPVFAQDRPELNVNLRISASWGGGDILNLDIFDLDTGERQQVAIRLSDFIGEGENVPYILLQAMDLLGERQSGVIQIENPLFDPSIVTTGATVGNSGSSVDVDDLPDNLQNIVNEANQPTTPPQTLTPDGTGTVVDNIMTVNNIEFFTVTTDNGSDFFLVVDRQRTNNNVYLLNTVTEADLMALADARGEILPPTSGSNVASVQPPVGNEPQSTPTMEEILQAIQEANEQNQQNQPDQPQTPPQQSNSSGIVLLLFLFVLLGGGGFAAWKWGLPMLKSMGQGGGQEEEIEPEEYFAEDEDGVYGDDADAIEVDQHEDFDPDNIEVDDFVREDFERQGGEDDE